MVASGTIWESGARSTIMAAVRSALLVVAAAHVAPGHLVERLVEAGRGVGDELVPVQRLDELLLGGVDAAAARAQYSRISTCFGSSPGSARQVSKPLDGGRQVSGLDVQRALEVGGGRCSGAGTAPKATTPAPAARRAAVGAEVGGLAGQVGQLGRGAAPRQELGRVEHRLDPVEPLQLDAAVEGPISAASCRSGAVRRRSSS